MTNTGVEEGQWRSSRLWTVVAILVFACALASLFRGFWGQDTTEITVSNLRPPSEARGSALAFWNVMGLGDLQLVIGTIARNASTLMTRPWHLFEAEQCYPAENALALGEPMISQGILAMPAYLLTRDPVATFNLLLVGITLFSALAMYWLATEWTGVPAAGIIAGLLYAFHSIKMGDVVHFYIWDSVWTVLALLFARRLFTRPRWLDAIVLSLCCALQIGGSLYPLLSAAILAVPFGIWLIASHGVRKLRWAHWACVIAAIGLAAFGVFTPYLELRSEGVLQGRGRQGYIGYSWLLPGERLYPGWILPGLGLAGLMLGRRRTAGAAAGDPRWALLLGGLFVLYLAAGGTEGERWYAAAHLEPPPPRLPNLYPVLAAVIPGLDVVRGPGAIFSGTHLALSILAGFGAAALIRVFPKRYATYAAVALVGLTYVYTLSPGAVGLRPRSAYSAIPVRPSAGSIDFFNELERLGNSGPILELPFNDARSPRQKSESVLLTAYHYRRTSQCYNSFSGSAHGRVKEISERLPSRDALVSLRELGFTTIVVHHGGTRARRQRFDRFAGGEKSALLERILADSSRTAYAIQP